MSKPQPKPALLGSASKLHRTLRCPLSCILPEAPEEPTDRAVEAMAKGQAIHRYLELAPEGAKEAETEVPEKYHKYCRQIEVGLTPGRCTPMYNRELAFVYDGLSATARVLDVDGPRDYGKLDVLHIPGTADVVIPGYYTCEVWDYKTGRWPVPAAGNYQLLFLALCASRTVAPHAQEFALGIQTLKGYGRVENDVVMVTREGLAEFEDIIQCQQSRALQQFEDYHTDNTNVKPVPGDHCRFCPCKANCPEGEE